MNTRAAPGLLPASFTAPNLMASRFLDADQKCDFLVIANYARALRAVADHPALDGAAKEARLKAVADVFEDAPETVSPASDDAVTAAIALKALLVARGLDERPAWQMLQAAGQDITKTRYPDWSDTLIWCRFWAAPQARLGFGLLGADEDTIQRAERFGIAIQLMTSMENARSHFVWLGRVYLPERWFRDAHTTVEALGDTTSTAALKMVFARGAAQVLDLLKSSGPLCPMMPTRRLRIAIALLEMQSEALAYAYASNDVLMGAPSLSKIRRAMIFVRGFCRGVWC